MGLQCGGGLPCEKEEINKWHICIFSDGCSFCTLAHFISCNHPWRSQNISEWIPDSAYWVEDSLSRISSTYLPMPPFFLSPIVREPRSRSPWLPRFLPWLHHHSGTVPTVPCPCLSSSRATGLGISQAHLVPPGRWWLSRLLSHHVPGFFSHSILGTVVCGSVSLSLLLRWSHSRGLVSQGCLSGIFNPASLNLFEPGVSFLHNKLLLWVGLTEPLSDAVQWAPGFFCSSLFLQAILLPARRRG